MQTATALASPAFRLKPISPQMLAIGFAYWLAFLLSLEPGNVARTLRAGIGIAWSEEMRRILAASLLGCAATPLLLEQVRRFPVAGPAWRRNALVQGMSSLATAAVLVAISCVLASWFLPSERRPLGLALRQELVGNGPLVAFCIAGFVALAHAFRFSQIAGSSRTEATIPTNRHLETIPVNASGRVTLIDVADIDWIETQGNYVALHVDRETHLIRESLARLEARLDPSAFLRVHRRTIIASSRLVSVTSLGSGDAQITLKDGTSVRLSRTYRDRIATLLARENELHAARPSAARSYFDRIEPTAKHFGKRFQRRRSSEAGSGVVR